jgi:hypothetical protein
MHLPSIVWSISNILSVLCINDDFISLLLQPHSYLLPSAPSWLYFSGNAAYRHTVQVPGIVRIVRRVPLLSECFLFYALCMRNCNLSVFPSFLLILFLRFLHSQQCNYIGPSLIAILRVLRCPTRWMESLVVYTITVQCSAADSDPGDGLGRCRQYILHRPRVDSLQINH